MKVLWLHNNPDRASGTFMWDILDRMNVEGSAAWVQERSIPLMRGKGALARAVRIAFADHGCSVVHAQYGALVGLLASFCKADVHVTSLRGSDMYWRYGTFLSKAGGLLRTFLSWIACLRSDAVIVMSYAAAKRVRRWPAMSKRPVLFVPDPAGEIFWPKAAKRLGEQLRMEPFSVIIASLQPGNPIKRTEIVSDAAMLCREAGMSVSLQVLSGIPRDDVHDLLAQADGVALASTHEGWPNIIKEGLLLGKPFVSTNVGDLATYATPNAINRIVEPDPVEFASAWVDQIAARLLAGYGISPGLAAFHPDVVAMKHTILYIAARRNRG